MDNYENNPGQPEENQQEPESENTFPPVSPGDQSDTPPVPEADDQPEMPPLPEGPGRDDRLWATFCHLAALVGYMGVPFGQILGPLVIWLIKREGSLFIDENGKKALNFQISIAIYMFASIPLACGGPLIFLAIIPLIIIDVVYTIIAAIKANEGKEVSYPISIEFIK